MWTLAGDDSQILIDYVVDGEFVVPTQAWATIRDYDGTVLIANQALDTTGTSTTLAIDGANNALHGTNEVEHRYVNVYFNHGGAQHRMDLDYRIHEFLPIVVKPTNVRKELGVDASELKDEDIDIVQSYFELKKELGAYLTDALTSGLQMVLTANRAIAVHAALQVVTSLVFRAGVKFASEESSFQRMSEFDLNQLRSELSRQLSSLTNTLKGIDEEGMTHFTLGTRTDPITGA